MPAAVTDNSTSTPLTGAIDSVADGRWIITLGIYGWIGFLAEFGLIALPMALLWRETVTRRDASEALHIAPLSLILAINLFDMLPNATLTPLTWLIAGALTGYAEVLRAERLQLGRRRKKPPFQWRPVL